MIKDSHDRQGPTHGPRPGQSGKDIGVDCHTQIGLDGRTGGDQVGRRKGDAGPYRPGVAHRQGKENGTNHTTKDIPRQERNDHPGAGHDHREDQRGLDEKLGYTE